MVYAWECGYLRLMDNIIEVLYFYIFHFFKFQYWRRNALLLKWGSFRLLLVCWQFFLPKPRETEFYLRPRWSIWDPYFNILLTWVLLVHSKSLFYFDLTKNLWHFGHFRMLPLQVDLPSNHCLLDFEYLRHQLSLWLRPIWSLFHLALFSHNLFGVITLVHHKLIRVVCAHLAAAP